MRLVKSILSVLMLGVLSLTARAQCPDFTDLNSSSVTCCWGDFNDSDAEMNVGVLPGTHTVITQQGTDANTGDLLPLLPDGVSAVVRLGDLAPGAHREFIVYTFTVDPDNPILLLNYAVVLQCPNHWDWAQPRFIIQVLNADGELLNGCMEYYVVASDDIPGFQVHPQDNDFVAMWRPWTVNGFDLSPYAGQTVKLKLSTYDCVVGAHYGYAYFTASCISNRISFSGCDGDQVTLTAPEGFESYAWSNGSTAPTTTYTLQGNTTATCVISTVTGCQFMQSVTFTQDTSTQDQYFYDTICEGMGYHNHGFDLPPQTPGDYAATNTFYDVDNCLEGATYTLYLHVRPLYTHIYDMVCEGDSYNAYGFQYDQLSSGIITDTNIVHFSIGCDSITILHLTVNHTFSMSDVINGPNEVCSGTMVAYSLADTNSQALNNYHWTVPDGVSVYAGQGTPNVQLIFSQNAPSSVHIVFSGSNGCGSSTIPFDIAVLPSYSIMYSDTVCRGNTYMQHGYQLGIQDSTGFFVHILYDSTQQGCDSISILQLFVAETPSVVALADPTEICVGSETELYAVGSQATVTLSSQLPKVWVGDILCTDGTIVHPEDWPCNREAEGVVFYVDNTCEHGWAVSLYEEQGLMWAVNNLNDIPALVNYNGGRSAMSDLDGYTNTLLIRQSGTNNDYEAAYAVDFEHGWYLPAAGQAYMLYEEHIKVNNTLQLVDGNLIQLDTFWLYWTSTEINSGRVWVLSNALNFSEKNYPRTVRGIRNF